MVSKFLFNNTHKSKTLNFNIGFNKECFNLSFTADNVTERTIFTTAFIDYISKDQFNVVSYDIYNKDDTVYEYDYFHIIALGI